MKFSGSKKCYLIATHDLITTYLSEFLTTNLYDLMTNPLYILNSCDFCQFLEKKLGYLEWSLFEKKLSNESVI